MVLDLVLKLALTLALTLALLMTVLASRPGSVMVARMERQFDRKLTQVGQHLVALGNLVQQAMALAIDGLRSPCLEIANEVKAIEQQVDSLDETIELQCRTMMALNSPVAADLRRVVVSMRVALILEDIGDEVESVARRTRYLARHTIVDRPAEMMGLAELAQATLADCLLMLENGDAVLARRVFDNQNRASEFAKVARQSLGESIARDPTHVAEWSHLLRAVTRLRNIIERGKELAEEAYFLYHKTSLRHHHEKLSL